MIWQRFRDNSALFENYSFFFTQKDYSSTSFEKMLNTALGVFKKMDNLAVVLFGQV